MKLDFTIALQLEFANTITVLPFSSCYSETDSLSDSGDIYRVIEKRSEGTPAIWQRSRQSGGRDWSISEHITIWHTHTTPKTEGKQEVKLI